MTDLLTELAELAEKVRVVESAPGRWQDCDDAAYMLASFVTANLPAILALGRERDALREALSGALYIIDEAAARIIQQYGDQCRAEGLFAQVREIHASAPNSALVAAEAAGFRRGVEAAKQFIGDYPGAGVAIGGRDLLRNIARELAALLDKEAG